MIRSSTGQGPEVRNREVPRWAERTTWPKWARRLAGQHLRTDDSRTTRPRGKTRLPPLSCGVMDVSETTSQEPPLLNGPAPSPALASAVVIAIGSSSRVLYDLTVRTS